MSRRQVCVRDGVAISLGDLKQHALRTARGQKIAYAVEVVLRLGDCVVMNLDKMQLTVRIARSVP
jgi:hypothetical protein